MKRGSSTMRWILCLTIAALAIGTGIPSAEAHKKKHKKHRQGCTCERHGRYDQADWRRYDPRFEPITVISRRGGYRDDGWLGGSGQVGTVLRDVLGHRGGNRRGYTSGYYDPYCERRLSSIAAYGSHLGRSNHPRILHVLGDRNEYTHTYRYANGNWQRYDDRDYAYRDRGGYCEVHDRYNDDWDDDDDWDD